MGRRAEAREVFEKVISAEQWIDMDLGPRSCRLGPFTGEHGADLLEADRGGDERAGIDGTARVCRDGRIEVGRTGQNAHRRDVLQNQGPGVDVAWAAGKPDVDHAPRRLDQVEGQSRQVRRIRGIDDRVEGLFREVVRGPDVLEPEAAGERE